MKIEMKLSHPPTVWFVVFVALSLALWARAAVWCVVRDGFCLGRDPFCWCHCMGIENDELRGRETGCRSYMYGTLDLGAYGLSPIVRVMRTSQGRWGGDSMIRAGGARTHTSICKR